MKRMLMGCVAVAGVCVVLSGCAMFNKTSLSTERNTTIGRELMDLKAAKDQGTITDAEYADLKKQIMKGGPFAPAK